MKRVLLMVDTSRASGRKFMGGIEKYISTRGDWEVCLQPPSYLPGSKKNLDAWFRTSPFDGLICRDSPHTERIIGMGIPKVINDTTREIIPGVSTIYTDFDSIGEKAARYFMDRGFENFAFCGFEKMAWSGKRFEAYSATLRNAGRERIYDYGRWLGALKKSERKKSGLTDWMASLPKPACVFACNDDRGIEVIQACKLAGVMVPEEVAVLGVDNDELVCDLSSPPLSSIELDFYKAGFEAASLLETHMARKTRAQASPVKALSIYTRRSTDIIAVNNRDVVKALVFIRDNFKKQIAVNHVVEATGLSRRMLELRFRETLQKSIMDEVRRLRIQYAQRLLRNTDYPVYQIANELEYTDVEHFARFFKAMTGMTPSEYRLG